MVVSFAWIGMFTEGWSLVTGMSYISAKAVLFWQLRMVLVHKGVRTTGQCPANLPAGSSKIFGVGPHGCMRMSLSNNSIMYVMLGQDPVVCWHFTSTIML